MHLCRILRSQTLNSPSSRKHHILQRWGEKNVVLRPILGGLINGYSELQVPIASSIHPPVNLPVVLLTGAGNSLFISAAIYADSIYAGKLFSLDLCFGPRASDSVPGVVCVLMVSEQVYGVASQVLQDSNSFLKWIVLRVRQ